MMKKIVWGLVFACALILSGRHAAWSLEPDYPDPRRVFLWSRPERLLGFRNVEKMVPVNTVEAGSNPRQLTAFEPQSDEGRRLAGSLASLTDKFMATDDVVGVLVIHKGLKLVEAYRHGFTAEDRWTSFSVAKSVTSTLTGAALKDGYLKSLDDPVTDYIPELKNTAYDGVTIRHLLSMTSGVAWNEDYTDPNSDTAKIAMGISNPDLDIIGLMSRLPREAEPGRKWVYKTGESNILGLVIQRAANKSLAEYMSEKIWRPYGMEKTAFWALDSRGRELGGCCLSMSLRDYGRFGLFVVDNGRIGDLEVLPPTWLTEATTDNYGQRYGLHWRLLGDGSFMASGVFGQMIYIDSKGPTVVVALSAWPYPISAGGNKARYKYVSDVRALLAKGGLE